MRIYLSKKLLGEPTRPYSHGVTVRTVVDNALESIDDVELIGSVDVFKDAADSIRTAQLPLDCLEEITVGELLRMDYGTNLVTHQTSRLTRTGCPPVLDALCREMS